MVLKKFEKERRYKMTKYKYFISFAYHSGVGRCSGFDNIVMEMDKKITSQEDIEKLEELIEKDNPHIIVLNFQLLN